ncbi:MAG: hypothetical protein ACK4L4_17795 [Gemmobacter sp.]
MGELKTFLLCCSLSVVTAAGPVRAGLQEVGLAKFADCAGRYSATVEHLWLFDGPASDDAARRRDAFADLVAAYAAGAEAMARRVAAKAAQCHLWERAAFSGDARADGLARDYLSRCDSLLIGA